MYDDFGAIDYSGYDFGSLPRYNGPKENYMFTMDYSLLSSIGFTDFEINTLEQAVQIYGIVSSQKLIYPPFCIQDQTIISRIMYAYSICMGKTIIDPDDPLSISKHMKKMTRISGGFSRFSCLYIKHRPVIKVPRTAMVAGLPEGSFSVLNSKNYDVYEASYPVDKIAQEWVTIKSTRRMNVTYKDRLNKSYEHREWGIPGILKVLEVGSQAENKPWVIQIHKSRCRLCNRFLVVISTRKVAEGVFKHHGGYVAVLEDGTILYVYAKTTDVDSYGNPKETVTNDTNDTIIFDYGFYASEISRKIEAAMAAVANTYHMVFSKRLSGETPFKMLPEFSGMENIRENNGKDDTSDIID